MSPETLHVEPLNDALPYISPEHPIVDTNPSLNTEDAVIISVPSEPVPLVEPANELLDTEDITAQILSHKSQPPSIFP